MVWGGRGRGLKTWPTKAGGEGDLLSWYRTAFPKGNDRQTRMKRNRTVGQSVVMVTKKGKSQKKRALVRNVIFV